MNAPLMIDDIELRTPLEALQSRILHLPNKLAMVQPLEAGGVRQYSWQEMGEQIQKMAGYLVSLNLPPASPIALISQNCAEWIMADLAIWMAGHVSVPLYPQVQPSSMRHILEHAGVRQVFVGKLDNWHAIKSSLGEETHVIAFDLAPLEVKQQADAQWQKIMTSQVPLDEWAERRDEELATIIYTSGTMGEPKGVMHNFGALKAVGNRVAFTYEMGPEDRVISYLPLAQVAERTITELCLLYVGLEVYFADNLHTFGDDVRRAKPTVFFAVPRIWGQFYQNTKQQIAPQRLSRWLSTPLLKHFVRRRVLATMGLDKCRIALSGAATLSSELMEWFGHLGMEILEAYGMTENLAWSHTTPFGGQRVGWVGTPNDGVECQLGEKGELLVKSPGNMLGYYRNEELTQNTLPRDGWLHTGDVGTIDDGGYLQLTGRLKEMFKTQKGKYVAPAPIEARLAIWQGVEQACVVGEGLSQPVALLNVNETDRQALRRDELTVKRFEAVLVEQLEVLNERLDPHERLVALIITPQSWTVENGILTPTLKVRRQYLEAIYAEQFAQWAAKGGVCWA